MLTEAHIKWIAPRARADYIATLTSEWGWKTMAHYGVNSSMQNLAGWMGNVIHETGGLTIKRESLLYKTPARLRAVWPKRFRDKSDAVLMALCNNERALADSVYSGRMGNRPGTSDAYDYRGWGFLQCTGRTDSIKYCAMAGINIEEDPSRLDDANVSLVVACAELHQAGCNQLMATGNFDGASAAINSGSAKNVSACVGLDDRRRAYNAALKLFGQHHDIMDPPASQTDEEMNPDGDTPIGQTVSWSDDEDLLDAAE